MATFNYNLIIKWLFMINKNKQWKVSKVILEKNNELDLKNQTFQINQNYNFNYIDKISAHLAATQSSADSSNAIEKIGLKTNNLLKREQDKILIQNYNHILNEIKNNFDQWEINLNTILNLHQKLFENLPADFNPLAGKFKQQQNYIVGSQKQILFTPVSVNETPIYLNHLCNWFNNDHQIDFLIKIPIFISDFLAIHPFNDGNGRISRLLTNLLYLKTGCDFIKYSSVEKIIFEKQNDYYESIWLSQINWKENTNNYDSFVNFHFDLLDIVWQEFIDLIEFKNKVFNFKLNHYEIIVLLIVKLRKKTIAITKKNIIKIISDYQFQISEASVKKVLNQLTNQKALLLLYPGKFSYYDLVADYFEPIRELIKQKTG